MSEFKKQLTYASLTMQAQIKITLSHEELLDCLTRGIQDKFCYQLPTGTKYYDALLLVAMCPGWEVIWGEKPEPTVEPSPVQAEIEPDSTPEVPNA